jgi:GNAT superfamily N-acetyltransferase
MSRCTIKRCPFGDLESSPFFEALLAEYATESHIEGMPPISAKLDMYRAFDAGGHLATFCAYHGEELVGFMTIIAPVLPHYSTRTAMTESYFVAQAHRRTGAGLDLLAAGEAYAQEIGSPGLFVSAPAGSALEKVIPRRGYRQTNATFFKRLA